MAMTAAVKDELSRVEVTKTCCRKAEVSSLLRFGGALHIVSGAIVVEVEVDAGATARRLRKDIFDIYGHDSEVSMVQASGIRKGTRYVVRVSQGGEALAKQTGIVDGSGRPVRGLPPAIVAGGSAIVRQPGGAPSWRMARSPNRADRVRWKSPRPVPKPLSRWWARRDDSGSARSPGRSAASTEW